MAHKEIGAVKLNDAIAKLVDLARLDSPPRFNGKRLSAMLSPDRARIDAYKRKHPTPKPAPTKAEKAAAVKPEGDAVDNGESTTTATGETAVKKPKKAAKPKKVVATTDATVATPTSTKANS